MEKVVDEAVSKKGWVIFALHAYRPCWLNKLPGSLVSEGGSYPDEWVYPARNPTEYPDNYLEPPTEKVLTIGVIGRRAPIHAYICYMKYCNTQRRKECLTLRVQKHLKNG